MPKAEVFFFRDKDGSVPVLGWLEEIRERNERAFRKCFGLIRLLEEFGHELRRPRADMLRDGVYELRTKVGNVNYRILYGFVGKDVALLAAGLTKEKKVPAREIDQAAARIELYKTNPERFRLILRMKVNTMAKTTKASEILKRRTGINPDMDPETLQIQEDYRIAQMIYDARNASGLTQTELAEAVGTTQSVISQLEDADYEGHSLSMIRRIAKALHRRLEIRMVPDDGEHATN